MIYILVIVIIGLIYALFAYGFAFGFLLFKVALSYPFITFAIGFIGAQWISDGWIGFGRAVLELLLIAVCFVAFLEGKDHFSKHRH